MMATTRNEDERKERFDDYLRLKTEEVEFSSMAQTLFKKYENPFEFCSSCLCYCSKEQLYNGEKGSLPVKITTEFNKFLRRDPINSIDSPLLTEDIQKRVFDCLFLIEPWEVKRSLVRSFCLNSVPEVLVPIITEKIQEGRSSMAQLCSIIEVLKCGSHINVDNVLLPLFLMNHYEIIEELLTCELCENSSASKLKAITNNICTKRYRLRDLQRMYNIKVIPFHQPTLAEIRNFGYRLDAYARTAHSTMIGAHKNTIAYLFRLHYKKNAISLQSLVLYSADLSKHDRKVMDIFILNLFKTNQDYLGAKMYWDQVRGPKVGYHPIVVSLKNKNFSPRRRVVTDIDTDWYKLNLSLEDVVTIDNKTQFVEAMAHLQSSKVIALDLEWKSANRYDEPEKISLLQIATQKKVYLMDTKTLCPILKDENWKMLGEIFSDASVLKLTYHRAGDDIKFKGMSRHLARMKNCIDLQDVGQSLLEDHPEVFSFKTVDYKGLSGLVFICFGKPLDKMEQCSYWDLRPLTTSQVIYAALDAYCLIDVYNYLKEKAEKLNLIDWKELKPEEVSGKKPFKDLKKEKSETIIKDAKFVCDNMLQKLYLQMLVKSFDAQLVSSKDRHDKCFEFFENEGRIILTNKTVYCKMRRFVPYSHILCIEESDVQKQLGEVQSRFGLSGKNNFVK